MSKQIKTSEQLYTYRNDKKVYLEKEPDQFVVRAQPEELEKKGFTENLEKVSSASTRVTVKSSKLNSSMDEMRKEAVTHHAYTEKGSNDEFLITDRIMVTFKQTPGNEQLSQFMARYALLLRNKYSEKEYLFQLTDQTGMNPVKLVVLINETEKKMVESCEHDLNQRMKISNVNIPADAKYVQQWHLHNRLNDSSFDPRSSSNCEAAWNLLNHYGSNDVVVAISDDGCKLDHPDFDSSNKFAHWAYMQDVNLINRDSVSANPQNMYQTGADHGTCCCGVIAAEVDGLLTVGAAPGCRLLPVKWESDNNGLYISDSKMMAVLAFISDKADVFSNSWGSSPKSNFASGVINRIAELAQTGGRRGKGIVFLWAAGNENCPIKFSGNIDIPYDGGRDTNGNWRGVRTSRIFEHNLTDVPGVMYVAALASTAQRSHYSNYGEGIAICAPTNNVHKYWRLVVTGLGIMTSSGEAPFFDAQFGGTSSATPLVAGIAALIISANPNLTALQVISVLQKTAKKDMNMTAYAKTPPATFDPNTSWDVSPVTPFLNGSFNNIGHADGTWSGWFGFGKADAAAAVAEALRLGGDIPNDNNVITQSSSPAKAIPDNNPVGISDVMVVNDGGTISSVKVDLDITHTYIGDLVVKLTSPRGTPAFLHERNGGSAKNIIKTFDLSNAPTLSRFNGESASGNWTLEVTDVAAIDTGTLNKWTIHIGTGVSPEIKAEETPGVTIPDNNPAGIERSLSITEPGTIKEMEVGVDVTHTYIGDLIVNLVSPAGMVINLHNKSGGSADNIIKTYNFINTASLATLKSQPINGHWKIKISDVAGQDIGKLNKWSVKIIKQ
ncbi:MAG: proprotein convertase P-domain-containing protein [Chitinophagaceae bacterium]